MMAEGTDFRRLFIGGLSNTVKKEDLLERLKKYGSVTEIELKSKHDCEGEWVKTFAYANIHMTQAEFSKCKTQLHGTKWKSGVLSIQEAKQDVSKRYEAERNLKLQKAGNITEMANKSIIPTELKGAVPGTHLPDNKNWVVTKFQRVVPVMNIRSKDKKKLLSYDPSKHCHQIKRLEPIANKSTGKKQTFQDEDEPAVTQLTWHLDEADDVDYKKKMGSFRENPPAKKEGRSAAVIIKTHQELKQKQIDDLEVVPTETTKSISHKSNNKKSPSKLLSQLEVAASEKGSLKVSNRFDSSSDSSDTEEISIATPGGLKNGVQVCSKLSPEKAATIKKKSGKENLSTNMVEVKHKNGLKNALSTGNHLHSKSFRGQGVAKLTLIPKCQSSDPSSEDNQSSSEECSTDDEEDISKQNQRRKITPIKIHDRILGTEKLTTDSSSGSDALADQSESEEDITESEEEVVKSKRNKSPGMAFVSQNESIFEKRVGSGMLKNKSISSSGSSSSDNGTEDMSGSGKSSSETEEEPQNTKKNALGKFPGTASILLNESRKDFAVKKSASENTSTKGQTSSLKEKNSNTQPNGNTRNAHRMSISTPTSSVSDEEVTFNHNPNWKSTVPAGIDGSSDDSSSTEISSQPSLVAADSSNDDSDSSGIEVKTKDLVQKEVKKDPFPESDSIDDTNDSSSDDTNDSSSDDTKPNIKRAASKATAEETSDSDSDNSQPITKIIKLATPISEKSDTKRRVDTMNSAQRQKEANSKRLEAMKKRQDSLKTQQKAIQDSLKSLDSKSTLNKRKTFSSSSDSDSDGNETMNQCTGEKNKKNVMPDLFGGDSDSEGGEEDYDKRFAVKPQFEGEKGAKLLNLQKSFHDDSRFKLTEKFMESDSDDKISVESNHRDKPTEDDHEEVDERKRNLEILQSIVGSKKVRVEPVKITPKKMKPAATDRTVFRDLSHFHYDPTDESFSHMERSMEKTVKPKKKKKLEGAEPVVGSEPAPEVSKERFFEMSADFTARNDDEEEEEDEDTTTKPQGGFGFGFFDDNNDEGSEYDDSAHSAVNTEETMKRKDEKSVQMDNESNGSSSDQEVETAVELKAVPRKCENPFEVNKSKFDDESSSEDESAQENKIESKSQEVEERPVSTVVDWFLFKPDDPRIVDGMTKFHRSIPLDQLRQRWSKIRSSLVEDYKKRSKKVNKKKNQGPGKSLVRKQRAKPKPKTMRSR